MEKTENQEVVSKKDMTLNRLKTKYPDKDFGDEETLYGQIGDDYDDYDKQIKEYMDRERVFADMFAGDPRKAAFMMDWKDGKDPFISLVERFGSDFLEMLKDPDRAEEIAKANKDYIERLAESKKLEEEYRSNLDESYKTLDGMVCDDCSEDDINEASKLLIGIANNVLHGIFSQEDMKMALKAIRHDKDVEDAAADGEVKGRNAKIDMKLRKESAGDGTVPLGGKAGEAVEQRPKRDLGAIDRFGASTIWDRGNEKRIKY